MSKVILIVTDSMGVGALPDAAAYGDDGADTFGHIAAVMTKEKINLTYRTSEDWVSAILTEFLSTIWHVRILWGPTARWGKSQRARTP